MEDLERQVSSELRAKGVCVKDAWLRQCSNHLRLNGPWSTVPSTLSEKVFQLFLFSDLYQCCGPQPQLPEELANMHRQVIFKEVVVILQVDEAVNISSSLLPEETDELSEFNAQENADKFRHAKLGRLNKLFVTDGRTQCVALDIDGVLQNCEYCPGMKIAVGATLVRRGALILRNGAWRYLGGGVKRLANLAPRPNLVAQENVPPQSSEQLPRQLPPPALPQPPPRPAVTTTVTATIATRVEMPYTSPKHDSPVNVHLSASSTSSFSTSASASPYPAAAAAAAAAAVAAANRIPTAAIALESDYDAWQSPSVAGEPTCIEVLDDDEDGGDLAARLANAGALEPPCSDSIAEMDTPPDFSSSGRSAPAASLSNTVAAPVLSTLHAVQAAARTGREYVVRGFASKLLRFRDQPGEPWDICIAMDDGDSVQAVRIAPSVAHAFLAHLRVDDSSEGRRARMLAFQGFSGIFRLVYDGPDHFATPLSSSSPSRPVSSQPDPVLEIAAVVTWHGPVPGDRDAILSLTRDLLVSV